LNHSQQQSFVCDFVIIVVVFCVVCGLFVCCIFAAWRDDSLDLTLRARHFLNVRGLRGLPAKDSSSREIKDKTQAQQKRHILSTRESSDHTSYIHYIRTMSQQQDHQEWQKAREDIMSMLRPFQREAVDFATQGKLYQRQFSNNDDSNKSADTKENNISYDPNLLGKGRILLADEMGLGKVRNIDCNTSLNTETALISSSFYSSLTIHHHHHHAYIT
jgi:hypothetical protein